MLGTSMLRGALTGLGLVGWGTVMSLVSGLESFDAVLAIRCALVGGAIATLHAFGTLGFGRPQGFAAAAAFALASWFVPFVGLYGVAFAVGAALGFAAARQIGSDASAQARLSASLGTAGAMLVTAVVLGAVVDRLLPETGGMVGQSIALVGAALIGMRLTLEVGLRAERRAAAANPFGPYAPNRE